MNNGQPVLMGIDLGTSSTKTVIVDLDGNLLARFGSNGEKNGS